MVITIFVRHSEDCKYVGDELCKRYNAGWTDRVPRLFPIKIDAPETEPLTDAEYEKIVKAATGKTRTLIKLMRWNGLAIETHPRAARGPTL